MKSKDNSKRNMQKVDFTRKITKYAMKYGKILVKYGY